MASLLPLRNSLESLNYSIFLHDTQQGAHAIFNKSLWYALASHIITMQMIFFRSGSFWWFGVDHHSSFFKWCVVEYSTSSAFFILNIVVSLFKRRERIFTKYLNPTRVIFNIQANKKVIDAFLLKQFLKFNCTSSTVCLEVSIIIKFLPQSI